MITKGSWQWQTKDYMKRSNHAKIVYISMSSKIMAYGTNDFQIEALSESNKSLISSYIP
jgi:hypothetical protein